MTVPIHLEPVSQLLGLKLMVTCVCGQEPVASPPSCISAFQKLPPACSIQLTVRCASPCCHFPGLLDPRAEGKSPYDRVAWPGTLETQEDKGYNRELNCTSSAKAPSSQVQGASVHLALHVS